MTSTALANVHRAQTLDRLYVAADAARARYFATANAHDGSRVYEDYIAWQQTKARYEEYRAMCTAAPLDPLLPAADEEEP